MTSLQWGHVFSDVEIFFSARMASRFFILQWGHVFSDVEMSPRPWICPWCVTLQWGHVFSDVEIGRCRGVPPRGLGLFNGATSFQTWKSPPPRLQNREHCRSSMGPRLFRRGNRTGGRQKFCFFVFLQWGHVFSDVEITKPSQFFAVWTSSSMGPRLFRRGNAPVRFASSRYVLYLQWGHVFSDVEI